MMHGSMNNKLNSGNSHYHSFQNVSSSFSVANNEMIEIYKTIILLVFLQGCLIWFPQ
jgi:hypothetical protein